jgi:hypothetical protein
MAEDKTPYWTLISVLFSSFPLTEALATVLSQTAFELHRLDQLKAEVSTDLVQGVLKNLRKDVLLGSVGGPSFEAELDTERGRGVVRFFLNRQGIALLEEQQKQPRYLN